GFGDIVIAVPRAADAWANYGTASWLVGDTAHAIAGWQRALRLEPWTSDMRSRVALAHQLSIRSAGYVPPVAPAAWFALGAVGWLVCWIVVGLSPAIRSSLPPGRIAGLA